MLIEYIKLHRHGDADPEGTRQRGGEYRAEIPALLTADKLNRNGREQAAVSTTRSRSDRERPFEMTGYRPHRRAREGVHDHVAFPRHVWGPRMRPLERAFLRHASLFRIVVFVRPIATPASLALVLALTVPVLLAPRAFGAFS